MNGIGIIAPERGWLGEVMTGGDAAPHMLDAELEQGTHGGHGPRRRHAYALLSVVGEGLERPSL